MLKACLKAVSKAVSTAASIPASPGSKNHPGCFRKTKWLKFHNLNRRPEGPRHAILLPGCRAMGPRTWSVPQGAIGLKSASFEGVSPERRSAEEFLGMSWPKLLCAEASEASLWS